jgi:hypothetical protein
MSALQPSSISEIPSEYIQDSLHLEGRGDDSLRPYWRRCDADTMIAHLTVIEEL